MTNNLNSFLFDFYNLMIIEKETNKVFIVLGTNIFFNIAKP